MSTHAAIDIRPFAKYTHETMRSLTTLRVRTAVLLASSHITAGSAMGDRLTASYRSCSSRQRSALLASILLACLLAMAPALGQYPPVAAGTSAKAVSLYDESGVETFSFAAHEGAVNAVLFTADGKRIVSAGEDGTVKIWNVDDGSLENTLDAHAGGVNAIALTEDGTILASGGADGLVKFWSPKTGKLLRIIRAHAKAVRTLAWSPDGKLLASGGDDRVIQVWRDDGSQAASIVGHDEPIAGVLWTRDGRSLISAAGDGYVKVWEAGDFSLVSKHRTSDRSIAALAGSVDGQLLATAGPDGRIRVYTFTGKRLAEVVSKLLERQVLCMAWSRDGKVLVTGGSDHVLRYWNGSDLSVLLKVTSREGSITAVAVKPQ